MRALLAVFLIIAACNPADFACHAQIPSPTDTNNTYTSTGPTDPYPPGRPPITPHKGNIYEWTTDSIRFYNDHSTNTVPLEIWWTDDLTDSNSWVLVGTATNYFEHGFASGFYGIHAIGNQWIQVDYE